MEETKVCQASDCEVVIVKTPSMSRKYWASRKYCSSKCARTGQIENHKANIEMLPDKACENPQCSDVIKYEDYLGVRNGKTLFRRRKYCSTPCQMATKRARTSGRLANQHRTLRPVTYNTVKDGVVTTNTVPEAVSQSGPRWRPAGFAPEPVIPPHIRRWNERNQQEQKAS